jgi:hypothetical protein
MYAHMMSDVSQEELHEFAVTIKVPKSKYHKAKRLHYDVTIQQVETAISNGATQVTSKQLIEIYKAGKDQ